MRIDLTCPVELWHFRMPTAAYPVCAAQLYNLSEKGVRSVQLCFLCFDEEGEQIARHVERVQSADAPAHCAFEVAVAVEEGAKAADIELIIEKVWFDDGTVWRRGANAPAEYALPAPLGQERLSILRELAGPDASVYPSDQGAVWVCVCGRPNPASDANCRRCQRDKHAIFTGCNEAVIEKILFERESAKEEALRRERAEQLRLLAEKEAAQKKHKRRVKIAVWTTVGVLLAVGLTYGTYHHLIPWYRYTSAQRLLDGAQYAAAKEAFLKLDDYSDAATMAVECDYQAAQASLSGGTYTSLRAAQDAFDALGAYKDSAALALEARYMQAEKRRAGGEWAAALALYEATPNYKQSAQMQTLCRYHIAKDQMDAGEYEAARAAFIALNDYQDAQTQALECLYIPGTAALTAGDANAAIEAFKALGDYRDALIKLKEAYYLAGDTAFALGEYEAAADSFLLADDYKDAYRRATQCLYEPAVATMDAGDYEAASAMFERILTYQDAQTRYEECIYQMGAKLMEEDNYDGAKDLFDKIPNNEKAKEAVKECVYQSALTFFTIGEASKGRELLKSIEGYKDADTLYAQSGYEEAVAALNESDYTNAIPLFEALGDYEDSPTLLKDSQYGYAIQLLENGELDTAAQTFTSMEGYLSSETYLKQARYQQALLLMKEERYQEAEALLAQIADYEGAQEQLNECVYQRALALLNEGNRTQAVELLADILSYKDAQDLYNAGAYQLAVEKRESGDVGGAAKLFAALGNYQDAAQQAESCYDAYLADAYSAAKAAYADKKYEEVVKAVGELNLDGLVEKYADLRDIWRESAYRYAEQLYEQKKPYEAYAYYQQILDYQDVATKKVTRTCYRFFGKWLSTKDETFEFREDGTCTVNGVKLYYYGRQYLLETGPTAGDMTARYQILKLEEKYFSFKNTDTGKIYRLNRVEESADD